jgi:hypothetical protein
MATDPSIDDLTNGMKQLTKSGAGKDLQLSAAAQQNYTNLISTYRTALNAQRTKAAGLANYGNVGGFFSAQQTKFQLTYDVTGPDGVLATLDKYMSYLDEFEKTVNAAFSRMQAEDKS